MFSGVNIQSQVGKEMYPTEDLRIINALSKHLKKDQNLGLKYQNLDIKSSDILICSDRSVSGKKIDLPK